MLYLGKQLYRKKSTVILTLCHFSLQINNPTIRSESHKQSEQNIFCENTEDVMLKLNLLHHNRI